MLEWNHLFENELQFFLQIKKNFSCSINFLFFNSIENRKIFEKKTKKATIQSWNEINFCRNSDSKFQTINFIDESNKKANRAFYNKISYIRNAMIILIINKIFSNSSEFRKINSKNVIAISSLYYLMSNLKKKINKITNMILNSIKNSFIERNARYFQIWLNRFRHDFFQSKKNRDLVSKIYTNKINKSKAVSWASNQFKKKSELNKKIQFVEKKFKNKDLIYKIFIVHTIKHSI